MKVQVQYTRHGWSWRIVTEDISDYLKQSSTYYKTRIKAVIAANDVVQQLQSAIWTDVI